MKKIGIVIASLVFVFAIASVQIGNAGENARISESFALQTEKDTTKTAKKCTPEEKKKCCAASKDKKACSPHCKKKCTAEKKKSSCGHKH
ncbi:MAG: hypothetical protein MI922_11305 [Bacteroidales bacterium]|nr:hypothetical protein [Bacteroidales bacterium]